MRQAKGTRDLAGYVLEMTDGGKELINALVSIVRGVMPNVAVQKALNPGRTSRCGQQAKSYRDAVRPLL